ncbi:dihydrofolate reductase [Chromobacterium phragmitis]|uniref:dihydrofolate reductase n=1 Tax=Chromobacterium phragmitis TaxID=2202141 RepID=A0ABV0J2N4_9NEIS
MSFVMIAAVDAETGLIGAGNKLIHRVPEDLARFRELTKRAVLVLMGRKTFESLPGAEAATQARRTPLPGRNLAVLTEGPMKGDGYRTPQGDEVSFVSRESVDSIMNWMERGGKQQTLYIAGGAQVYREMMPRADAIEITEIKKPGFQAVGDAYFPKIDPREWELSVRSPWYFSDAAQSEYRFLTYTRIKKENQA